MYVLNALTNYANHQTVIAPPPDGRVTLVPAVMLATLKTDVAVIEPVPPPMLPISPTVPLLVVTVP